MSINNSYTTQRARALGFRSGFECDVADYLDTLGAKYVYEDKVKCCFNYFSPVNNGKVVDVEWNIKDMKKGWRVVQLCNYTVDFAILSGPNPWYIETKGRFTSPDRKKHRLLKEQYPKADIRILFQYDGKATPKLRYSDWCDKYDISYGFITKPTKHTPGKFIPDKWMGDLTP